MTKMKRAMAVIALGGVGTASWFVGSALVKDVQYARAVEQVETAREQLAHAEELAGAFRTVGKAVEPSVVHLRVTKKASVTGQDDRLEDIRRMFPDDELFRRFFPDRDGDGEPDLPDNFNGGDGDSPGSITLGQGSGVIVEADGSTGWIVTNNHVAGNSDEIRVTLADGREIRNAKLVGADPKTDLAVVRIDADRLIAAKWGDSTQVQKGDFVLAFGAPFGLVGSMTHGIISGFNRQTGILGQFGYEDFLQTDCSINPGNSGGPLVNLRGEIVGINSAILTRTGSFQGVGFAIPANQAKAIYQTLKETGRVTRGYLGVSIFDASRAREEAERMGIEGDGVIVASVQRGGPAVEQLEPGDKITAINGKEVKTVQELRNTIAQTQPGTETTFTVLRNGEQRDVKIRIAEQPDDLIASAGSGGGGRSRDRDADRRDSGDRTTAELLGLTLTDPTPQVLGRYGVEGEAGAVITRVAADSPAGRAGLRPGDVVTKIGDREIKSADEALDALTQAKDSDGVRMNISNKDGKRFVFVQLGNRR